jgi:hypothetical protein
MRRWGLVAGVLLVVLAGAGLALYISGRRVPTDREQIQARLLEGARALEQKRISRVLSLIADDYNDGLYTKAEVATLVRGALWDADQVRVAIYLRSLDVQGDWATMVVDSEVEFTYGAGQAPSEAATADGERQAYSVTLDWRRGPRGWQVVRAQGWQSAPGDFSG